MDLIFRNLPNGRSALSVSDTIDGAKQDSTVPLILSTRVDDVTHDRLWVAAAVCYGRSVLGRWASGPPISETAYLAIIDFLKGNGFFFVNDVVRVGPQYRTGVSAKLVRSQSLLSDEDRAQSVLRNEFMVLETVPLGDWAGALFSLHHYIVATNAFLHDEEKSANGALATAVLLSNDLSIDEISVNVADYSAIRFEELCRLLSAVGLTLTSYE